MIFDLCLNRQIHSEPLFITRGNMAKPAIRRPNLRQVEAFRAVMLTGSATAGAAFMGVTQPAVSKLLRDFQHHLKLKLFERRGTGIAPTAEAVTLFGEVERSFIGIERIA